MNVKALCIHMERHYLGHGSPPPPTPHCSYPPLCSAICMLIQINSYKNECKILLHPHGTSLSWPWFPPHPTPLGPSTINSYLNECKSPLHPHGTSLSWPWFPPQPPPPHPTPLGPSTINSYLNECKSPLHPHGTSLSWPWFPPPPTPHCSYPQLCSAICC